MNTFVCLLHGSLDTALYDWRLVIFIHDSHINCHASRILAILKFGVSDYGFP